MARIDVVAVRTAVKNGELKIVAEKGFFFMEDTKSGERVKLNEAYTMCKDCKHIEITGCYGECRKLVRIVKPWDFCSYGERKENV